MTEIVAEMEKSKEKTMVEEEITEAKEEEKK